MHAEELANRYGVARGTTVSNLPNDEFINHRLLRSTRTMPEASARPLVSIVVVTKNEEKRLRRCLEGVLSSVRDTPGTEILLVDSGSSDGTVNEAAEFPIRIVQLKEKSLASASAGRFLGTIYSNGEFIQFVDADCVLDPDWIHRALSFMQSHPDAAGVRGIISQPEYQNPLAAMNLRALSSFEDIAEGETSDGLVCGVMLIRRSVLEEAGNFNPYLLSEEEGELNQRMIRLGARFWYLRVPMVTDYGYAEYRRGDVFRKMMRYKTGYGQVLRLNLSRSPSAVGKAKALYFAFRGLAAILAESFAVLVYLLWGSLIPLAIVIGLGLTIFAARLVRHRSLASALRFVRDLHIEWPWIAKGFLLPVRNPETFPRDVTWFRA